MPQKIHGMTVSFKARTTLNPRELIACNVSSNIEVITADICLGSATKDFLAFLLLCNFTIKSIRLCPPLERRQNSEYKRYQSSNIDVSEYYRLHVLHTSKNWHRSFTSTSRIGYVLFK